MRSQGDGTLIYAYCLIINGRIGEVCFFCERMGAGFKS